MHLINLLKKLKSVFFISPDLGIEDLFLAFKIDVESILHCGAGLTEEAELYDRLQVHEVTWIESMEEYCKVAKTSLAQYPRQRMINATLWSDFQEMDFRLASNGGSSSLLESKYHSQIFPEIEFKSTVKKSTVTLDSLNLDCKPPILLILDLQGAELKALEGATKTLKNVDFIYVEISVLELYSQSPTLLDISRFLQSDFKLADWQVSKEYGYGNFFFLRKSRAHFVFWKRYKRIWITLRRTIADNGKFWTFL